MIVINATKIGGHLSQIFSYIPGRRKTKWELYQEIHMEKLHSFLKY